MRRKMDGSGSGVLALNDMEASDCTIGGMGKVWDGMDGWDGWIWLNG